MSYYSELRRLQTKHHRHFPDLRQARIFDANNQPPKPAKVMKDKCARTACNRQHDGCQGSVEKDKFYCIVCARKINEMNMLQNPNLVTIPSKEEIQVLRKSRGC